MKKVTLLLVFLSFLGIQAFAQTTVSGTVTSAKDGQPVPGASVVVKGFSTAGTIADFDGKYSLSVPQGGTVLIFSFMGMETKEVTISGSVMNAVLAEGDVQIDDIVVVAYGVQRKEASTGSVAVMKMDDVADIPITSADKILQGKIAGVQVNNVTGQPGAASEIRIRGFSSITANNEPLIVLDGVPIKTGNYSQLTSTGNILSSINPSDIESMTVLKDASSTSIYGSRAANGVILITTKSGKKGKPVFKFSSKYGVSEVLNDNDYRMMNGEEAYGYVRQGILNAGLDVNTVEGGFYATETLPGDVETVNWMDYALEQAVYQNYEFSATGGDDKNKFFVSGGYMDQEGVMISTGLERYSFRANLDSKLSKKLTLGVRVSMSYTDMKDRPNNGLYYVNPIAASSWNFPWELPYNDDGSYNFDIPSSSNSNYIASAEYNEQGDKTYKNFGTISLAYEPIPGLTFRTQNSADYAFIEGIRWWDPRGSKEGNETGTLQETVDKVYTLTTTNTAQYRKSISDHNFSLLVGQEAFKYRYQDRYLMGQDLGYKIPNLSGATRDASEVGYSNSEQTFLSFFGMLDYSFNDRFNGKLSFRRDGNSRFGENEKWANFYAVGASWNLHNESFLDNVEFINMLKIRTSYGVGGNDGIGNYTQYGNYTSTAYNGISGMRTESLSNPDLTWELNTTTNVGLDFALFDKLQGSFDFYNRVSTELLLEVAISQTSGFSDLTVNTGGLTNTGFELNLLYNVIDKPVRVDLRFNGAFNETIIDDLGGEDELIHSSSQRYRVDGNFLEYYLADWAGVNPADGMGLWYTEDGELTEDANQARQVYAGQAAPKYMGGFGMDVSWKGFSLSASFEFKTGFDVYLYEKRYLSGDGKYTWNSSTEVLDYWQEPGDVVANPKPIYGNPSQSSTLRTTRFLQKGDYLRFKDLTVSYSLPSNIATRVKMSSARIYLSATNIYTWHDVTYWDPERNVTGYASLPFPLSKSVMVGLDLSF